MQNPSTIAALLAASLLIQTSNLGAATTGPTLVITYPTTKLSVTTAQIAVTGETKDTVAVTNVLYQLKGGTNWTSASTTNKWTNWTAQVTLTAGPNTLAAFAVDTDGNRSKTNTVSFTYTVSAPLTVQIAPIGTFVPGAVTPNYNGKPLTIGAPYTMTAKPDKGFAFVDWTGSISTNKSTLSFVMASNFTFTAHFKDMTPPVLVITSPAVHATVTNAPLTVSGKTMDNVGVTNVLYQLNGGVTWSKASTTDNWTNWTAQVALSSTSNIVAAYAEDAAGLYSKTNSVSFTYKSTGPAEAAPAALSGLMATVTQAPNTNIFMVSFGATTFSQNGTNQGNNSVGVYSYDRLTTNTALLTLTGTAPPNRTNQQNHVMLTFTNSQLAGYINTNSDGSVSTGSVVLATAPNLVPHSPVGLTFDSVDSATGDTITTVYTSSKVTFTNETTKSVTGGTYAAEEFSPIGALVAIDFNNPTTITGSIGYLLVTYSGPKEGTFFQVVFLPDGTSETPLSGTFKVK